MATFGGGMAGSGMQSGVPGGMASAGMQNGVPGGMYDAGVPGGMYGAGVPGGMYGAGMQNGVPGGMAGAGMQSGVPGGMYGAGVPGGMYGAGVPGGMYGAGMQNGTPGVNAGVPFLSRPQTKGEREAACRGFLCFNTCGTSELCRLCCCRKWGVYPPPDVDPVTGVPIDPTTGIPIAPLYMQQQAGAGPLRPDNNFAMNTPQAMVAGKSQGNYGGGYSESNDAK